MNTGMTTQKPKYGNKAKICYKDTESFIFHIKSMKTSMQISLEILGKVQIYQTMKLRDLNCREKPKKEQV